MVHQQIRDAQAQHRHKHIVVDEAFHHGRSEAAGQGAFLKGHHPTDPTRHRQDQGLIKGPQEAGIDHGGPHPLLLQKSSGGHGRRHHGAIGHQQQVVAIGKQLAPADLQGLPTLLHQGDAFALTPRDPDGTGSGVGD